MMPKRPMMPIAPTMQNRFGGAMPGQIQNPAGAQAANPAQMVQALMQNPAAILQRSGLNIPANLQSPSDIIQYLMNSGQISQQQFERARHAAQAFFSR